MERIGLVLVVTVGILSSTYGYQIPGRKVLSETTDKATSKSVTEEPAITEVSVNKDESSFICIKDGLYPDPMDCNQFIQCSNSRAFFMKCPSGLHFSSEKERCERPEDAACDQNIRFLYLPLRENDEIGYLEKKKQRISFTCKRDGMFASHEHCNQYYECSHGKLFIRKCHPGRHFNKRTKRCDTPCKAKCDPNIVCLRQRAESLSAEGHVANNFISSEPSKKVFKLRTTFACSYNGLLAHPTNCSKYINCSDGNAHELSCPSNRRFNNETKECETLCSVKCDPNLVCNWRDSMRKIEEAYDDVCNNSEEDHYVTFPNSCEIYYFCQSRELNKFHCPIGQHFSEETSQCEDPCVARCDQSLARICGFEESTEDNMFYVNFFCSKGKNFKIRTLHHCDYYFKCNDGEISVVHCPDGQHLNNKTFACEERCIARCDYSLAKECGWGNETTESQTESTQMSPRKNNNADDFYEEMPEVAYSCDHGEFYPDDKNCSIFYECSEGKLIINKCFSGYHYNRRENTCETPCEAQCDPKACLTADTSVVQAFAYSDSTESSKKDKVSIICHHDGTFSNPANCSTYIRCIEGNAYEVSCPPGKHFNNVTKNCEPLCSAKCDPNLMCNWRDHLGPIEKFVQMIWCAWTERPLQQGIFHCDTYLKCVGNEIHRFRCPNGQHFNPIERRCEEPCDAHCDILLAEECGWKEVPENPFAIFKAAIKQLCSKGENAGIIDGHCDTFLKCNGTVISRHRCRYGQHFNVISNQCEDPCSALCDPDFAERCGWEIIGDSTTSQTEIASPTTLSTPKPKVTLTIHLSSDKLCTSDGTYLERNPLDCSTFFKCIVADGEQKFIYLFSCPQDYHFNQQTLRCEEPCDAQCDSTIAETCDWKYTTEPMKVLSNSLKQSVDFQCPGNGLYATPTSCENFLQCTDGQAYLVNCPRGQHYEPYSQSCTTPCEARCEPNYEDYCKDEKKKRAPKHILENFVCQTDGYHVNPLDCGSFIQCFNGDAYIIYCPGNLHYSSTLKMCMPPCDAKCTPNYEEYCREGDRRGFRCPAETGIFGNYPDCSSYYHCKRGIPTLKMCPKGKAFDHKKSKCVRENEATCLYECRNTDAVYPYEEDCRKYISCVNGISKLEKCPAGKAFDPEKKNCIDEKQVRTCFW